MIITDFHKKLAFVPKIIGCNTFRTVVKSGITSNTFVGRSKVRILSVQFGNCAVIPYGGKHRQINFLEERK